MSEIYEYDETAIRMAGGFADRFFNEFEKYKDKYKPSTIFTSLNFENIKIRNALDNYILKNYTRLDKDNPVDASIKRNMDKYLQAFYKKFLTNPTEFLDSPFLKSPQIVNTFCPEFTQIKIGDKNQDVELRKKVKETYRENIKEPELLYVKDINLSNLSREETNRLMHYFISNIGTENKEIQKYQAEYIKKLISQKSKTKDLSTKQIEFVAKYVNSFMLNSRLKQLGYDRKSIQSHIYIGEERESLGGFENNNNIYINKNSSLTADIPSLIQVVCHETEHSIQGLEAKQSSQSKIGLDLAISDILRNYYSTEKGYDVYHNNYRFEQIEKDSENIGFSMAIIFLDVLGFQEISKKMNELKRQKSDSRRFEYDYRVDENGKKFTREEFFFNNLNEIVGKDSSLIGKYPSLSLLYNQDGNVKSFEEIISADFKVNDQSKSDILEDFCKYYISKGELKNFDLSKFPEETQANIASRLISILGSEYIQLGQMGKYPNNNMNRPIDTEDKKHVEFFHLKNSKNIMQFINKNYKNLMELQDRGKFSSIINMDSYGSYAGTFKNAEMYQYLAYDNMEHINELKQLSIEAKEQNNRYHEHKKQKFTQSNLEESFENLVENAKTTDFTQVTQSIKMSIEQIKQNEHGAEVK